jgi:hypothetical protein
MMQATSIPDYHTYMYCTQEKKRNINIKKSMHGTGGGKKNTLYLNDKTVAIAHVYTRVYYQVTTREIDATTNVALALSTDVFVVQICITNSDAETCVRVGPNKAEKGRAMLRSSLYFFFFL